MDNETSFNQEYDPRAKAALELTIYCRLCRRTFAVSFRPRPEARLRCLCGHEATLAELDVFSSQARAKDFSALYDRLVEAARDALRQANIAVPPSGRLVEIRDGDDPPSDMAAVDDANPEDMSDVTSSYVGSDSDLRGDDARDKEEELRGAAEAAKDTIARHDALSALIEHLYCVRHVGDGALERFEKACREDMAIARDVVAEARRRKQAGRAARVTFTSFKHLAIVFEEEGNLRGALAVVEEAIALGLGGYDARADRLRESLARAASSKKRRPPRTSSAGHLARPDAVDEEGDSPAGLVSSSQDSVLPSSEDISFEEEEDEDA